MAEAIFTFRDINTIIQCDLNDKMKDIIDKFLLKITEKGDNFFYLYNGTEINKELSYNEQANNLDKSRNKMNIIVTMIEENINEEKEIISKDIICPKCKENIL